MSSSSLARVGEDLHVLTDLIARAERLVALTGAGCSTASGIPDYRDRDGEWKRDPPMGYQTFLGSEKARRRYWARSMVGWGLVEKALPNAAHRALAHLEEHGALCYLITQNVDRLHQKAGSRNVNDLHGRIDFVRCVDCGEASPRVEFQARPKRTPPFERMRPSTRPTETPMSRTTRFRSSVFARSIAPIAAGS